MCACPSLNLIIHARVLGFRLQIARHSQNADDQTLRRNGRHFQNGVSTINVRFGYELSERYEREAKQEKKIGETQQLSGKEPTNLKGQNV
jgi:hypothetical protein